MAWRHGSMGCSGVEAVPPPQQPAAVRIPDSCSAAVRCVIVLGVEGGVGRSGWACTDRSGREAAAPHSPAPRPCPTQEEAAVVTGQEDPEAAAVAVLSSPGSRGQWCVLNSLRSWFRANPQAVCVRGLSHHCCPESSLTAFCAMLCALCCSCAVWATRPEPTQWHTHTHVHTRTHTHRCVVKLGAAGALLCCREADGAPFSFHRAAGYKVRARLLMRRGCSVVPPAHKLGVTRAPTLMWCACGRSGAGGGW